MSSYYVLHIAVTKLSILLNDKPMTIQIFLCLNKALRRIYQLCLGLAQLRKLICQIF